MNKLTTDFAKNDSIKKVMTLISNKRINKHLDKNHNQILINIL